jgi:malate dehydrogenase (oxaloacetate-decarboxylating)(NADP+)
MENKKQEALDYHASGRPGKIEVVSTKPTSSQRDLSLAYSPGVAEPCLAIEANPDDAYRYTAKGNLVGVISNGTAVLGLGDIGPLASKPVMEGKGILFKLFADLDVFDIEVDATDIDRFVETVKAIAPTFGGINLEDIKAPECFEIERRLKEELQIPIMHDDQHGTAIITGAALLNALELVNKRIDEIKIVFNGAGASAISCAALYFALGAKPENLVMCDSKGVIRADADALDPQKARFATQRDLRTLAEAMAGADVFVGLSKGNVVSTAMVQSMASNPIVFALANPTPEIPYDEALAARPDVIMATGRSDHPNQVNNVLGFPFIFRGAMDVRATCINEAMKLAAVKAIAQLAKETVPDAVNLAYGAKSLGFGKDYIIPKPIDSRLIYTVAPAVARAAMESGVARKPITDWEGYEADLRHRMGLDNKTLKHIAARAKQDPQCVVFAEADHYKILKAAHQVKDEGIAIPILLGDKEKIRQLMETYNINLGDDVLIIDCRSEAEAERRNRFGDLFFAKRQRRGYTQFEARRVMAERNYFGAMMVETGEADAMISGLTRKYPDTIRPSLEIFGLREGHKRAAGMYMMLTKQGPFFFADTTLNLDPTAEELVDITLLAAEEVRQFGLQPRIALLSYSNFGSAEAPSTKKVREAVRILHERHPDLVVDGEVQANLALNTELMNEQFPFSPLAKERPNTLIFPNLESGNIAYKLMQEMGNAEAIGPVLLGLKKSVHVLQLGSSVREIVNMVTIAVVDAQFKKRQSQS